MNFFSLCTPAFILLAIAFEIPAAHAQVAAKSPPPQIDVLELRAVPAGNYLVTLQLDGREELLNIEVKEGMAKCVNSTAPRCKGAQGKFDAIGNGVFIVFLNHETYRASQFWAFRRDGSGVVKEVPDRGEMQTAVPVKGDSIEAGKKP